MIRGEMLPGPPTEFNTDSSSEKVNEFGSNLSALLGDCAL